MAVKNLENYNTLFGITKNTDNNTIDVEVGFVSWDCDVHCICDAIDLLASDENAKSITIKSFNFAGITINKGESPVDVYKRIQAQYKWYWDAMPDEIAEAQKKFDARKKKSKKESDLAQSNGSEPGERE